MDGAHLPVWGVFLWGPGGVPAELFGLGAGQSLPAAGAAAENRLIPLIYIFPLFFGDKLLGVFAAEPVADLLAAATTTVTFLLWARKSLGDKKAAPKAL